jgi:uncharacterized protein (TIGR03435 family)
MNRVFVRALSGFVITAAALAQAPAVAKPEFEVASVRPSSPDPADQFNLGIRFDGAMMIVHSYRLKDYVGFAYQVREFQVTGPDTLNLQFDLNAKIPENTPRKQLPAMVQTLLEDRFKLAIHRDKKEFPVYALTVLKGGPKLKAAPLDAPEPGADKNNVNVSVNVNTGGSGGRGGAVVNLGNGAYVTNAGGKVDGHKISIPQLVETLGRFVDRPIVDVTGISGTYDVTLPYGVDDLRALLRSVGVDRPIPDDALPPASLSESLKAVGLSLEARKSPLDIIVVDHIEKTPAAN